MNGETKTGIWRSKLNLFAQVLKNDLLAAGNLAVERKRRFLGPSMRERKEGSVQGHHGRGHVFWISILIILIIGSISTARAESLDLEGQSGGITTPFAYTVESKANGASFPAVAFHLLSGGDVVGTHFQMSVTVGFLSRAEVGITRSAVSEGSSEPLSGLFDRGFSIFHGKMLLVPENEGNAAVPAISAGFLARYQRKHIEGGLGAATQNGDFFVTATKTISQIERAPVVLSGGVKVTNASIMGLAGNSPTWAWCGFIFAGVNVGGRVLLGAEYTQQPEGIKDMAGTDVPGTAAFLLRLLPDANGRLSIDVGLLSLAGTIGENLDVKADDRYFLGAGYRF
jgi:hypothetical protein